MANLTETAAFEPSIYQLETTDPVVGGPNGIDNKQAKQLANRTQYLKAQLDAIETQLNAMPSVYSKAEVNQFVSDLEVFGDGSVGSTVINVANFFTPDTGACYLHFKLPLKSDEHNEMFHLHIHGYAYGEAKIVDATLVGYCYAPSDNVISTETQGSHTPTLYKGSDNTIYARLSFTESYYLTVAVDTLRVGNGRLLRRGDIEITKSANQTL